MNEWAESPIRCRGHRTQRNRIFMSRSDYIFVDKRVAKNFVFGRFGALFMYLEMPELGAGTQGEGGYCEGVYQWILRNWNAEVPCIIGTARQIISQSNSQSVIELGVENKF